MDRDELIEVGARSLYGEGEEGPTVEAEERRQGCRSLAEDVIDAVEPIIRADEQSTVVDVATEMMNEAWAALIVKVRALQDEAYIEWRAAVPGDTYRVAEAGAEATAYQRVLDLLNGSSNA